MSPLRQWLPLAIGGFATFLTPPFGVVVTADDSTGDPVRRPPHVRNVPAEEMFPGARRVDPGAPGQPNPGQPNPGYHFPPPWDGFVEPRDPWPAVRPWYLGVYGDYTATGMLLTRVFAGTPAERAGLEPGDRIVSVNGRQIGMVLGYRIPIDRALQWYVGHHGVARLLVLDKRTKQLVNLDVRLIRAEIHTLH